MPPIQEETSKSYTSVNKCMHDGMDAHAVILLGKQVLSNIKEDFAGEIRLFFQHAEEVYPGGDKKWLKQA